MVAQARGRRTSHRSRSEIEAEVDVLRASIEDAKLKAKRTGTYASSAWWRDANRKLREVEHELQEFHRIERDRRLLQIALAADTYLYSEDTEDGPAADNLAHALDALEEVDPQWKRNLRKAS